MSDEYNRDEKGRFASGATAGPRSLGKTVDKKGVVRPVATSLHVVPHLTSSGKASPPLRMHLTSKDGKRSFLPSGSSIKRDRAALIAGLSDSERKKFK